ncbi:LLM class flavin-dependent oxidoreductase [Natronococcus sp.]|uniref:LLM class flavin-dependent oxidoreductase n=1 Tax=Natronococcus sp. TaxID=35747 RepID=UPI0025F2371A|nr:LLM class flavin-dependent oxidoreductase [Natronococcus sp.]
MHTGLLTTSTDELSEADVAVRAEELGYADVWLPELWGESGVVRATEIATRTDELGIGSAILNVYSRSPAVLAMTAASLQRVSDGRFVLGVGTSTQKSIEDLHGESFNRPVRRAHETIELVRAFTAGEGRVDYDGELLEASDFPSLEVPTPIYHAGLGPANRRVVGRLADGWIPHNIPFSRLEDAFEEVAGAARERDRDPDDIAVAPYVPAAVSEDLEAARDAIRSHVAYYVGSGEGYRRAVGAAYPGEAERIAEAWRDGNRGEAADAVTDELVDDLGVAGTPEDARDRLESLVAETGIDHPIVVVPDPASDEIVELTVESLAPV